MTKSILAALTIAVGLAASAGGASAGIYDNLPDWKKAVFTGNDRDR